MNHSNHTMKTKANTSQGAGRLNRLVRLWRWLIPRKKWMITWGCNFKRWAPRKELRWFWMGDPCALMIDGCGPFEADDIDDALSKFYEPNAPKPSSPLTQGGQNDD